MKEKIKQLIIYYKASKDECFALLEVLNGLKDTNLTTVDRSALEIAVIKAEEEYSYRSLFLQDLEDLLN